MGSVCARSTNTSDIRASPTPFTQDVPVDHKYRYTKTFADIKILAYTQMLTDTIRQSFTDTNIYSQIPLRHLQTLTENSQTNALNKSRTNSFKHPFRNS